MKAEEGGEEKEKSNQEGKKNKQKNGLEKTLLSTFVRN